MPCRNFRSSFLAIVLSAFLAACGSQSDAGNRAGSEQVKGATTISNEFLEDGKIWIINDIRCGTIETIQTTWSFKFEKIDGQSFGYTPFAYGPY